MPIVTPEAFADAFAALPIERRAQLLARIWEERGGEVRRIDPDGSDRHGERIRVETDGRTRVVAFGSASGSIDRSVDTIVVPAASKEFEATANDASVELLTAEDVRNLLLYGIDRHVAEQLYREYFDRSIYYPIDELEPDPPIRERVPTVGIAIAIGVVMLVVALAIGGPIDIGGDDPDGPTFETPEDPAFADTDGEETADASPGIAAELQHPAVGPDGEFDLDGVVSSHPQALNDASFVMTFAYDGPENGTSYEPAAEFEFVLRVENATGYRSEQRIYVPGRLGPDETWTGFYADGEREYRMHYDGQRQGYDSRPLDRAQAIDEFTSRAALLSYSNYSVERFLQAENVTVSAIDADADGETAADGSIRVTATGTPTAIEANVSEYLAIAEVAPSGVVTNLTVEYRDLDRNETVWVNQTVTGIDSTTVDPPEWYEYHPDRVADDQDDRTDEDRDRGDETDTDETDQTDTSGEWNETPADSSNESDATTALTIGSYIIGSATIGADRIVYLSSRQIIR